MRLQVLRYAPTRAVASRGELEQEREHAGRAASREERGGRDQREALEKEI